MKTICIISDMVNNSPTTKTKMFRFTESFTKNIAKEIKTEKSNLIDHLLWFTSVEEAEKYLEKL